MPDSLTPSRRRHGRRISILTPTLAGGGAERAALFLASGLLERGHAVDLVLERLVCHYPADVPFRARLFFMSGVDASSDGETAARGHHLPVSRARPPSVANPLPPSRSRSQVGQETVAAPHEHQTASLGGGGRGIHGPGETGRASRREWPRRGDGNIGGVPCTMPSADRRGPT